MLEEFKKFALKGNALDLAVGVIIGGAFGKIVTSLVNDVIMPVLGIILGKINLTALEWVIIPSRLGSTGLTIKYGQFLQTMIDFLLVAVSMFLVIKAINSFKKKEEPIEVTPVEVKPSKEELLLAEIRDILRDRK